jgi:hypothetical protein
MTNTEIPGYEAILLRNLSKEYCSEYHEGRDKARVNPGISEEERRKQNAKSFGKLVKHLQAAK